MKLSEELLPSCQENFIAILHRTSMTYPVASIHRLAGAEPVATILLSSMVGIITIAILLRPSITYPVALIFFNPRAEHVARLQILKHGRYQYQKLNKGVLGEHDGVNDLAKIVTGNEQDLLAAGRQGVNGRPCAIVVSHEL